MKIEKLSHSNLNDAIKLRDSVFKYLKKCEKVLLEASLDSKKYQKCLDQEEIIFLEYFVMKDKNKVVGLTGIYVEKNDKEDECWLGWFCVDKTYRNQGLGQKLLDFSIKRVKELNKKTLKLYTYDSKEFQAAMKLYEKNNFIQYKKSKKDIFYKLRLA